ncbi:MAG: hypothetical protein N2513_10080, partial [Deltaproteobacteria bacterium]|nr:hypothetical protein [Deltaproteobacteria bacterium]
EEEISKIISYWESHFYRGLCLLFKNYPEIALKHFYIALRESSLRKEVQRAIAVSFFTLERYNRAIRLYRNLILEGLKEKDIIMGGLLSSVMLNGHLMDTFVKAIPKGDKELVENPTNFRALANSIDPLLKSLITKREDRLTMLFSKLIVDSFQNNTNKTKKTTKVYSGYIRY